MTTTQIQPLGEGQTPPPATDASNPRICPHCGTDKVRESSTRRGTDLMPSNIGKIPYRCRTCRERFYLKDQNPQPAPDSAEARRRKRNNRKRESLWKHPSVKRHMSEISIGVCSLTAFAVFLYLLARSGISF